MLDLSNGKHNLGSDTLKFALTNTAPSSTHAVLSDITELSAGNGYSAGGVTATLVSNTQTAGVQKLIVSQPTITASGGTIGPFRYVVFYNSTPTSPLKPLIGYYDYTTNLSITSGNSFQILTDQTNGVLQNT